MRPIRHWTRPLRPLQPHNNRSIQLSTLLFYHRWPSMLPNFTNSWLTRRRVTVLPRVRAQTQVQRPVLLRLKWITRTAQKSSSNAFHLRTAWRIRGPSRARMAVGLGGHPNAVIHWTDFFASPIATDFVCIQRTIGKHWRPRKTILAFTPTTIPMSGHSSVTNASKRAPNCRRPLSWSCGAQILANITWLAVKSENVFTANGMGIDLSVSVCRKRTIMPVSTPFKLFSPPFKLAYATLAGLPA